ncbi:MAG: gluconate 2-dehydrogenase subunit 3 family protein [Saprospiraceae bacterium]|nr:gluconate 2-dehydrogenase subunit 3 family protein [Saprospiraceae bacterium]
MNRREHLKQTIFAMTGLSLSMGLIEFFEGCSSGSLPEIKTIGKEELDFLDELAEIIIPQTDTIGAKGIGAAAKILAYIENNMEVPIQEDFRNGLLFWKNSYDKQFTGPLHQRSEEEKHLLMDSIANQASTNKDPYHTPFFPMLKGFVMLAYFTSEEVGKKVLAFDPNPGTFISCIDIDEHTRQWTI